MTFPVFTAGGKQFGAIDIVDAAWFRGDLTPLWEDFQIGLTGERWADQEGLRPEQEVLQELSEEIRYRHELITAEETEAWLQARHLGPEDLTNYSHRRYWREHARPPVPATKLDYVGASPELRQIFVVDLWFGGHFDPLAQRLGWRAAGAIETSPLDSAQVHRRDAARADFFRRTTSDPVQLAQWLGQLGRDEPWFETLIAQEADHVWGCTQVCTPVNRVRMLATLRLPLTCFAVQMMDLESADAVREACSCLTTDGLSMEELAAQERYQIEQRDILLEEFPEELQQRFLSAENGQVFPLLASDERFQVCRIVDKREPTLDDDKVLDRVDAELLAAHFGNLVSRHVVWLVGPGASRAES